MIIAYQGGWPQAAKLEKHALEQARVLLPPSDACIYIAFPWASLSELSDTGDTLSALTPPTKPGQRIVTVCEKLDGNIEAELERLGVTDVFIANGEASSNAKDRAALAVTRHCLECGHSLWLNEVLALFVEHSEHLPSSSFRERLNADILIASGLYKEQLRYISTLTQVSSVLAHRPRSQPKQRKKLFLFGEHSHRTPLSYPDSQYPLVEYVEIVDSLEKADVLVTGNRVDFIRNAQLIADWYKARKGRQLYVVSEEPYWDTMWDKDFTESETTRDFAGSTIAFKRINHVTSGLFKWRSLPYYITTETHFFARYAALFKRNAKLTADDWLAHWSQCKYPTAFVAEKRDDERFMLAFSQLDMHSDCILRSQLAKESLSRGGLVEGKGWFEGAVIRQDLQDWHLDKLYRLDMKVQVVSALENTHHIDYVTEKIFDAYAVGGIPVYSANPETHSVWRLIDRSSLINLYGLDRDQSLDKVFGFSPDRPFAERYAEAQKKLAELFSKPWLLWEERKRLAAYVGELFS